MGKKISVEVTLMLLQNFKAEVLNFCECMNSFSLHVIHNKTSVSSEYIYGDILK